VAHLVDHRSSHPAVRALEIAVLDEGELRPEHTLQVVVASDTGVEGDDEPPPDVIRGTRGRVAGSFRGDDLIRAR
jgi:hypothetical protein